MKSRALIVLVAVVAVAVVAGLWWTNAPGPVTGQAPDQTQGTPVPAVTLTWSPSPTATATTGQSPAAATTATPAATPGPDQYTTTHQGQTLPDPPRSAQGAGVYDQVAWPPTPAPGRSWQDTATGFAAALADTAPDQATWLDGLRPYVSDRLATRLAQDGARASVQAWGAPQLTGVESVNEDIAVQLVHLSSPNPAWDQTISMYYFADGTWRVDTCALPWQ